MRTLTIGTAKKRTGVGTFVSSTAMSGIPGSGASHWSNYTGPNFAVMSTSLHAAGAASAGLGIVNAT